MKKLLIVIIIMATVWTIALAATGDFVVAFVIPAADVAEFKAGFLARCPNTETFVDPNSDPNLPRVYLPKYTDEEWISEKVWRLTERIYRQGIERLAKKTAVVKPNIGRVVVIDPKSIEMTE